MNSDLAEYRIFGRFLGLISNTYFKKKKNILTINKIHFLYLKSKIKLKTKINFFICVFKKSKWLGVFYFF